MHYAFRQLVAQPVGLDHQTWPRAKSEPALTLAEGKTLGEVAEHGLLKPRQLETVSSWAKRYVAEGVSGLAVRPGTGRKPGNWLLRMRSK